MDNELLEESLKEFDKLLEVNWVKSVAFDGWRFIRLLLILHLLTSGKDPSINGQNGGGFNVFDGKEATVFLSVFFNFDLKRTVWKWLGLFFWKNRALEIEETSDNDSFDSDTPDIGYCVVDVIEQCVSLVTAVAGFEDLVFRLRIGLRVEVDLQSDSHDEARDVDNLSYFEESKSSMFILSVKSSVYVLHLGIFSVSNWNSKYFYNSLWVHVFPCNLFCNQPLCIYLKIHWTR